MKSALVQSPSQSKQQPARLTSVLHLVNGQHYSGAERVQDLLAGALPRYGYSVGFVCLKPGLFSQRRRHRDVPLLNAAMRSRLDLSVVRRIAEWVADGGYRVIHAHTPRSLWIGARVARRIGVPLVYHVHSPAGRDSTRTWQNRVNLWLENRLLRRAERLICVSSSVARYMAAQGHPAEKIRVVPNGVPVNELHDRPPPSPPWTLGIVALFRPRKGLELMLEALARTRRQGAPSFRLLAVGPFESSEYQSHILRLAATLQVEHLIEWTGFCGDVDAQLRRMDTLVLPSLFGEGLPMVVLEAMASGLPVIASEVEGIPEAIRDARDGLLFAAGRAEDLYSKIDQLIRGQFDWEALRQSAWRRQRECFSDASMAEKVGLIYRELLTGP
jgi:glycosyltransferase involved in cell wall biosynthesis